jgi:methanol--5-hydroxybenzimidazolylcobamide Co-methyltransferase
MNVATASSAQDARQLRDWLADSDAPLDPQAWVLRPEVVLRLAAEIMAEPTAYLRTRRAIRATVAELSRAHSAGELRIPQREMHWLDVLRAQADALPEDEDELRAEVSAILPDAQYNPEEYGLPSSVVA